MFMKMYFILIGSLIALQLEAQTVMSRSVPTKSGQKVSISFDYPELIKISTWEKSETEVVAQVKINNGENDDAFELIMEDRSGIITIENRIKNMKNLPQTITVVDGAQKISFQSKEEYRKYKAEKGHSFNLVSTGVDMEITVEIKVPKNAITSLTSTYGMVEVKDYFGPLNVTAQYGGVDAALSESLVGELSAETNYGQIYSNLSFKFEGDDVREKDFYTLVSAKPGKGPRYVFESKYGNVYLRKSN